MTAVTVSPKYQVVIPREIREALDLKPEKIQVIRHNGRVELIPARDMASMRGFLKGIDTEVPRGDDRV